MQKRYTKAELTQKKTEAARLIVVQGWQQKDAARHLAVSCKTMCKWAKKYGWSDGGYVATVVNNATTFKLSDFEAYLTGISPNVCRLFKKRWNAFVKQRTAT